MLVNKLPHFFDPKSGTVVRGVDSLEKVLKMFEKPVSLAYLTYKEKRPMQEF